MSGNLPNIRAYYHEDWVAPRPLANKQGLPASLLRGWWQLPGTYKPGAKVANASIRSDAMGRPAKAALLSILACFSCSSNPPEDTPKDTPKDIIEQAAQASNPLNRLHELYPDTVLPIKDTIEAFSMSEKFAKQALQTKNTGYLVNTIDFPWFSQEYVEERTHSIEESTKKPYRNYRVECDFNIKNIYGAEVQLNVSAFLRTPDNNEWECYQIYITNPSVPILQGRVVTIEQDTWEGHTRLDTPDSLIQRLDAYLRKQSK